MMPTECQASFWSNVHAVLCIATQPRVYYGAWVHQSTMIWGSLLMYVLHLHAAHIIVINAYVYMTFLCHQQFGTSTKQHFLLF